ncbi:Rpn family recombination-promoting nuclease/putative transposase [Methanobrevibacter filiformis]|uniref:PD-(D/E)XK nuclease family transposase n=1 Tax=Methanobrevibacter filiformis TaxID=55758 RepID=A0A162FE21_9EURY|nr:Rpn family recombination-promoting nuclease/putative transposase [Methanobrevibacter filiformis]KZX11655.1 PD-(D/E)XK nuclease family transposase [Methanobrevibacter filiformis]
MNDYLFKKTFGEIEQEENLKYLLNLILGRSRKNKIIEVEIVESTISGKLHKNKKSILDVRAKTKTEIFNIEVQLQKTAMGDRSIFYSSQIMSSSINSGKEYIEMPKVIMINILGFENKESRKFIRRYLYLEEDELLLFTDKLETYEIDMIKFRKLRNKDIKNPTHRLLMYLDIETPENIIKELINMDKALANAQAIEEHVTQTPEEYRKYQQIEMYKHDQATLKRIAKEEGIEEGIEKGRNEEKLTIAVNLKKQGLTPENISKATGIPVTEIEKL